MREEGEEREIGKTRMSHEKGKPSIKKTGGRTEEPVIYVL
jgi:hypothetical protein